MTCVQPFSLASCAFSSEPDGADHGGADMGEPLAGDQPDAAGRRVPEHDAVLRNRIGLLHEIAHGHALQHHRRRGLVGDIGRQLHQPVRRDQPLLGIAANRAGIGHAVANREVGHASPTAITWPAPSLPGVNGKAAIG